MVCCILQCYLTGWLLFVVYCHTPTHPPLCIRQLANQSRQFSSLVEVPNKIGDWKAVNLFCVIACVLQSWDRCLMWGLYVKHNWHTWIYGLKEQSSIRVPCWSKVYFLRSNTQQYGGRLAILSELQGDSIEQTRDNYQICGVGCSRTKRSLWAHEYAVPDNHILYTPVWLYLRLHSLIIQIWDEDTSACIVLIPKHVFEWQGVKSNLL